MEDPLIAFNGDEIVTQLFWSDMGVSVLLASGISISCCVGRGVGSLSLVVLVEEWDLYLC